MSLDFVLTATLPSQTSPLPLHDALPILTTSLEPDGEERISYPSNGLAPDHFPLRLAAAILTRVRSPMISRSNWRSEEHTSEPSHLVISYAVFCLKKKKKDNDAAN